MEDYVQNLEDADTWTGEEMVENYEESLEEEKEKEIDESGDSLIPDNTGKKVPPALLDPNHPLLARFQKSLKDYLLKQIKRYKEDILELESSTKEADNSLQQLGAHNYEMQQLVAHQQSELDNCLSELDSLSDSKVQLEKELDELNVAHKQEKDRLAETEKKEMQLKTEVESVNLLLFQMKKWEEDVESVLHVKQRESDKTRSEKIRLAAEKKQQDILLYKLMEEVWRLERNIQSILMQLKVMEEKRESLAEAMALTNIEIETKEADQRGLIKAWQSIIITITYRDKYYNNLMADNKRLQQQVSTLRLETRVIKMKCNEELLKNQSNSVVRDGVANCNKTIKNQMNQYVKQLMLLNTSTHENDAIQEQLLKDTTRVNQELQLLNTNLNGLVKEYERLTKLKYRIEDNICEFITQQKESDFVSTRQELRFSDFKAKNRERAIHLIKLDNSNSRILKDLELQQLHTKESTKQLDRLRIVIATEDQELLNCDRDITKTEAEMTKYVRSLGLAITKLNEIMHTTTDNTSPWEMKVKNMEKTIAKITEKNKETEMFWLREQGIVVGLCEKRQKQIKDLNMLKKQITIMDQKNLKLKGQLEFYAKQEECIARTIETFQTKLATYAEHLCKMKYSRTELGICNNNAQSDLIALLEEEEFDSLKIKNEISEIQDDKVSLSKDLIEKNREALCWEKKIKFTLEGRKSIQKELGNQGDIGKIKAEIHRMEVRFAHLRRTQEKLICHLEQSITRREGIVNTVEARTKLSNGGVQRMKIIFSKKVDNLKNNLQQLHNQDTDLKDKLEMVAQDLMTAENQIELYVEAIRNTENELKRTTKDLKEATMNKNLTDGILLYKQRKLKVYAELARGRSPFLIYRTKEELSNAYEKAMTVNTKLRFIVEYLIKEFPTHNLFFTQIYNSLVLPAISG